MYDEFQLKDINYIQGCPLVIDFADLQGRGIFISQNEENNYIMKKGTCSFCLKKFIITHRCKCGKRIYCSRKCLVLERKYHEQQCLLNCVEYNILFLDEVEDSKLRHIAIK